MPKISIEEYKKQTSAHAQSKRFHNLFLQQIKDAGIEIPKTEHRFDAKRRWRFDFAWTSFSVKLPSRTKIYHRMIAVEIEGGLYTRGGKGGHSRGASRERDMEKYNNAVLLGWQLYCFSTKHVTDGTAIAFLKKVFAK